MDFLEKLNYLMEKKHLNKSTLSKACDIPYTTIDGWYKRGYEGLKLPTLKKLSNYFGISLDYWADDELIEPIPKNIGDMFINDSYTNKNLKEAKDLLDKLSPDLQNYALKQIKLLLELQNSGNKKESE